MPRTFQSLEWRTIAGSLSLLWAGVLTGVSFLATPVKFTAASITLPVALDVGRVTFAALNLCEIVLVVVLVTVVAGLARSALNIAASALLLVIVVAQTLWLLPELDERVTMIIAGTKPPPSSLHLLYVLAEGTKLVALVTLAAANIRLGRRT